MEADSSVAVVAVVFRCFEEFLRKAGTMDVFDTLVYNYRLKDEFLSSTRLEGFSAILKELIQSLTQLRAEIDKMRVETSQFENLSAGSMLPSNNNIQVSEQHSLTSLITFPLRSDNFNDYQQQQLSYSSSNCLDKDFLNMITLDSSNFYPVENDDPKNGTLSLVVGDLQTLFSVELDSAISGNLEHQSTIFKDNIPETMHLEPVDASVDLIGNSIDEPNNMNSTAELFLIPILKEMVKSEEELSISNICSMLENNFESNPEQTLTLTLPSEKQLQITHMEQLQIQNEAKKDVNVKQDKGDVNVKDEPLLFFCCDKCFHSFRTQDKFSVHKCTTNSKGHSSDKNSSTLIKDNIGLRSMKKFVCGLCLEEYRNLDRISFHLKRCEGGPFPCEMCETSAPQFLTMKSLNFHKQQQHKEERSFICKDCGFPFKFKCSLQKHKLRAHNTELQPKTFPCNLCSSVFFKKIFLTNHKVKHHNIDRGFLCQVCGQSYSSQQSLKAHLDEVHYETVKFSCKQCNKVFTRNEQLNFHIMAVHTGLSKTHLCEACGKSFSKKSKLDEHYRRRHTIRREIFSCTFPNCTKSFKSTKDQRLHFSRVHGKARRKKEEEKARLESNETNVDGQNKKKKKTHKSKKKKKNKENASSPEVGEPITITIKSSEKSISIQEEPSNNEVHNNFNPASCDTDLSCQGPDEIVMSDFMNALTPGQIEQIIHADLLVPTLIP